MDLTSIINTQQAAKAEREALALKKREDEIEKEKQRISLNADVIKAHFFSVIEPLLDMAKQQIEAAGAQAQIEKRSIKNYDRDYPMAIGLMARIGEKNPHNETWLDFVGSFDSVTVEVSERQGYSKAVAEPSTPLSTITKEYVEKRLEAFVKKAFA